MVEPSQLVLWILSTNLFQGGELHQTYEGLEVAIQTLSDLWIFTFVGNLDNKYMGILDISSNQIQIGLLDSETLSLLFKQCTPHAHTTIAPEKMPCQQATHLSSRICQCGRVIYSIHLPFVCQSLLRSLQEVNDSHCSKLVD